MCLILLAWQAHPDYPLVIAANRDEFFSRPTEAAHFWPESPDLLAGRDLQAGGTWLGLTRTGRFAALTNYREVALPDATPATPANPATHEALSRGQLVSDFLQGSLSAPDYLAQIATQAQKYRAFSLICGRVMNVAQRKQANEPNEPDELWYASNRTAAGQPATNLCITPIAPGIHGLSNSLLDVAWPKVISGTATLAHALHALPDEARLFRLLHDHQLADDDQLPRTGVSLEWERQLSALFVQAPHYGTRSSSVLVCQRSGDVRFDELTYEPCSQPITTRSRQRFCFKLTACAAS
ncbi:MAG: NRDE family protein [Sterolibacterium sp.]|jgi:uncharacterized protein with NRDE domain|nr:NRDE family protein [Sterolibacterium sp.]